MPFMPMRAAAIVAVGFLIAGSSQAALGAARIGGVTSAATAAAGQCPAHWTADDLPIPAPATVPGGSIQSVAALSTTDVFALLAGYQGSDVYHFTHGSWQKLVNLNSNGIYFGAVAIVAHSDTDVWVIGQDEVVYPYSITFVAWHYDGSTWTDHPATLSPVVEVLAAAMGSDGVLYVVGSVFGPNGPDRGLVWANDGSGWRDLTPPSPRYRYDAVAVTPGGTLVVGASNGLLQERTGATWTTVRLSTPVTTVTSISAAPDGTVYAVGAAAGNQPVLIEQRPGSRSATVLDAPAASPSATTEIGVVAAGQGDVWLLGQAGTVWITHFDGRRFVVAATPDLGVAGAVSLGPDILAYGGLRFMAVCPAQVTRDAIVPAEARASIGGQMFWSVPATAASEHELVARGLFDSGPIGPGGSFPYTFFAAATYAVKDTRTGAAETVQVPPAVSPASGTPSTVYAITCATRQAPVGYAYRLLIERPGSGRYTLLTTTSDPTAGFVPYQGTGTYQFECQLQTPDGVTAASPPAAVQVSLLMRLIPTVSVLAAAFLTIGPSVAARSAGTAPTGGFASCPAHWTAGNLPVPPAPRGVSGRVESLAAVSPTDVWMLVLGSGSGGNNQGYVYHLVKGSWQGPVVLGSGATFDAVSIAAKSDSDVWVVGTSGTDAPEAWQYDGSTWTNHAPTLSSYAELDAAAQGSGGTLYVAGFNGRTSTGLIWRYDGSRWTDLTPADPASVYQGVAVTADGTLVAGGTDLVSFEVEHGVLQERSGSTWKTVSLSRPVYSITGVSVAPGGTVYALGQSAAPYQPLLIEQRPGRLSASVLDAPAAAPATSPTAAMGVVAVGAGDVWLFGEYEFGGTWHPWITHFDGDRFIVASTPGFSSDDGAIAGGASLGPAVLGFGSTQDNDTGQIAPTLIAVCPVQVTRDSISPARQRTVIGSQMFWSVPAAGGRRHELVAPDMFDSGQLRPGGSFAYTFFAAATYAVRDTRTGAAETLRVPASVTPASGGTSTVYTVTCASLQAPAGYAYRLLIERPGSGRYALLSTTSQPTGTFLPYHGSGTYRFECQVQTPEGVTGASPPATLTVSSGAGADTRRPARRQEGR
jgi:hypothetical protein